MILIRFILIIIVACLNLSCDNLDENDLSQDILDVESAILLEERAFAERDYSTWQKYWVQTEDLIFVSSEAETSKNIRGWNTFNDGVQAEFNREPVLNFENMKTNISIETDGMMAFATYDSEHGPTEQRDKINYYTVMIKKNNEWKYIYMHQVNRSSYERINSKN